MPKLADCQECTDEMVSKLLCYLPISRYYGVEKKQIARFLDRNSRRRYLLTLILFNDQEKADFDPISEQNSSAEISMEKSLHVSRMKRESSGSVKVSSL